MFKFTYAILILAVILLNACSGTKKIEETNPKPGWVLNRPITQAYYTGIGIAKKWGTPDNYKSEARQKALADMAGQVNAKISSTSVLHKVEDRSGINEIYSSCIKSSSLEYLEGYQEADSYEDENYYYVY